MIRIHVVKTTTYELTENPVVDGVVSAPYCIRYNDEPLGSAVSERDAIRQIQAMHADADKIEVENAA